MTMKRYINFYDQSIPIGTRKRQYINWSLSEGTAFWQTINQANKMFGKKPDYTEPVKASKCEHLYEMQNLRQDVWCTRCGEVCGTCGDSLSLEDICTECGFYDYI